MKTARTFTEEAKWRAYEDQLRAHTAHMEQKKPKREDFVSDLEYDVAYSRWVWESVVDAPNKPGYEYANNH